MRIAICSSLYPTPQHPSIVGGAEVFVRQFAENLVERGDEVVVIRASLKGARLTETVNGVTVEFVPVRNLFAPFQAKRHPIAHLAWHLIDDTLKADPSIRQILAAFKPDLLHTNTLNGLSTDVWRTAKDLDVPILHTLHDYYLICPRCSRFRDGASCGDTCGSCRLLTSNRRGRVDLVDAVASVSRRTLALHQQHGLFANTPQYVVANVPNDNIEFTPQITVDGPLILGYLGRFSIEKGVRLLAEAVGRLPKGDVRFLLAGNVSEDEKVVLRSMAPEADLEFLGFVKPSEFYAKVHLVAIPSIWDEPGALALVDALAAGRPVIGTDFGGIPEIINDGITGWIARPDADGLADVLRELVTNPAAMNAAHSELRARQVKQRTFSNLVDEYRAIYTTLTERAAPAAHFLPETGAQT